MLHFAAVNPTCLYSMRSSDQTVSCIDLYDIFPTNRHRYQPSIRIASLGSSASKSLLLHEQVVSHSSFLSDFQPRFNVLLALDCLSDLMLGIVLFYDQKRR